MYFSQDLLRTYARVVGMGAVLISATIHFYKLEELQVTIKNLFCSLHRLNLSVFLDVNVHIYKFHIER